MWPNVRSVVQNRVGFYHQQTFEKQGLSGLINPTQHGRNSGQ